MDPAILSTKKVFTFLKQGGLSGKVFGNFVWILFFGKIPVGLFIIRSA
jgi:hypothetical protein